MKTRNFGKTDITVSEIGFGAARLGGIFSQGDSKDGAVSVLQSALDQGITFFDTADMYAQGESEALIGRAFHGKRSQVILASKVGYSLPTQRHLVARIKPLVRPLLKIMKVQRQNLPGAITGTVSQNFSPLYIASALEASLRRIKTDYLDFYQLHSPPADTITEDTFADTIATLEKLKSHGKIRHYGIAVDSVDAALAGLRYGGISSIMVPFSLIHPEAMESLFARAEKQGIGIIARGCYGGGLFGMSSTEQELRKATPDWQKVMKSRHAAKEFRRSLLEMALQFSLHVKPVSITLLGMRTNEHLAANLKHYAAPPLTDDEYRQLVALISAFK